MLLLLSLSLLQVASYVMKEKGEEGEVEPETEIIKVTPHDSHTVGQLVT